MVPDVLEHYREEFARLQETRSGETASLRALRLQAFERFLQMGFPTTKGEAWKYTNVSSLAKKRFVAASEQLVSEGEVATRRIPNWDGSLLVFVNGRWNSELSALREGPKSARVLCGNEAMQALSASVEKTARNIEQLADHPFAALNTACFDEACLLQIPSGCSESIHLLFLQTEQTQPSAVYPRLFLVAETGSEATVLEDYAALGKGPRLTAAVSDTILLENSRLNWVRLQREGIESFHVSRATAHQARDSRLRSWALCLSGALIRNEFDVLLEGEGAECVLNGLCLGDESDHLDNQVNVEHLLPHGNSRQLYKSILGGHARGVFNGRIIVHPAAQHSDARQDNKNLLLSEKAEVNTKPELEIHADDVKCSHGSSTGQLQEDALFYLRARGVTESEARTLLTHAFASEVLSTLPIPALHDFAEAFLAERLQMGSARRSAA